MFLPDRNYPMFRRGYVRDVRRRGGDLLSSTYGGIESGRAGYIVGQMGKMRGNDKNG